MSRVLVVVDMQNDFISGALGTPQAREIVGRVAEKVREYRRFGGTVVYTADTHDESYLDTQEGKNLPIAHCIKGTEGWLIPCEVRGCAMSSQGCGNAGGEEPPALEGGNPEEPPINGSQNGEPPQLACSRETSLFEKAAFGSRSLAESLESVHKHVEPIEEIELVGLCTDICVISNALLIKAFLPEVRITVDAACCAGVTPESHRNALEAMRMCQVNVIND